MAVYTVVRCGIVLGALALSLAACERAYVTPLPSVARVEISRTEVKLAVGDSVLLVAQPIGTDGRAITSSRVHVAWSTDRPDIARVTQTTGWVVAVAPGQAAVLASARGKAQRATVTVVAR